MRLNPAKCKEMSISFQMYGSCVWQPISIRGLAVSRVESFKLLGVHISQDLSWSVHCDAIIKKAIRRLYAIRALKKSGIATEDLVLVYCSLIRSVIEYTCAAFANLLRYLANALEKVQMRALAIILSGISYELAQQQV